MAYSTKSCRDISKSVQVKEIINDYCMQFIWTGFSIPSLLKVGSNNFDLSVLLIEPFMWHSDRDTGVSGHSKLKTKIKTVKYSVTAQIAVVELSAISQTSGLSKVYGIYFLIKII